MKRTIGFLGAIAGLALGTSGSTQPADDPLTRPIAPSYSARWLGELPPVRLFGNSYFVGFAGLGVVLIDTGDGLILIDGAVPQAVERIKANMRRLGFRIEDVKYILSTEPHYDHAGGIAALARDSGATAVASEAAAPVLRSGRAGQDDPQFDHLLPFPAVARLRTMADGETLRLGEVAVTARATPGHTAGSMSWSWRSCEAETCLDLVFGSSLNAVSADGYRFSDPANRPVLDAFRATFRAFRALPCDLLVSAHPDLMGEDVRLRQRAEGRTPNPMVDPSACRTYADGAEQRLEARLAREAEGDEPR